MQTDKNRNCHRISSVSKKALWNSLLLLTFTLMFLSSCRPIVTPPVAPPTASLPADGINASVPTVTITPTGSPVVPDPNVVQSPSQEWLAWIVGQGGPFGGDPVPVLIVNGEGSSQKTHELANAFPFGTTFYSPSPNGRYILKDGSDNMQECGTGQGTECLSVSKRYQLIDTQSGKITGLETPWEYIQGSPTWSPDSQSFIAALSLVDQSGRATHTDLYRYDIFSGTTFQLTSTEETSELFPAWSPDGQYIAFARYPGSSMEGRMLQDVCAFRPADIQNCTLADLYLSSVNGEGERKLLVDIYVPGWSSTSDESWNYHFDWSPDSNRLAVMIGISPDIAIVTISDGSVQILAESPAPDLFPTWSPDGQHLLFVSLRDGNKEIYRIDQNGKGLTNLTRTTADDTLPEWSPSGRSISFLSRQRNPQAMFQPFTMDIDGESVTQLFNSSDYLMPLSDEDLLVIRQPRWLPHFRP